MRHVFYVDEDVPDLPAEQGDYIVVDASSPDLSWSVVKPQNRNRLPLILKHQDRLTPASTSRPFVELRKSLVQRQRELSRRDRRRQLKVLP